MCIRDRAANNPAAIIISGILFAGLKAGAMSVNRVANIPMDYIMIIQALVIVFIAAPKLIHPITVRISGAFAKMCIRNRRRTLRCAAESPSSACPS